MSEQNALLSARDISVAFGGKQALRGVSVSVSDGEIVSVIGPNGAGKTTLLNAVCGVAPKTQGAVHIRGRDITHLGPAGIARHRIARTFQDPRLIDNATVRENVLCGAHLTADYGMFAQVALRGRVRRQEREMTARADELLALAGLADLAGTRVSELGYGPRKLIDIVRGIMAQPELILLDEPSSGLDGRETDEVRGILLTLRSNTGVGMLVVEHHMDLVRAISDQVVALESGSVVLSGPAREVLDSDELRVLLAG